MVSLMMVMMMIKTMTRTGSADLQEPQVLHRFSLLTANTQKPQMASVRRLGPVIFPQTTRALPEKAGETSLLSLQASPEIVPQIIVTRVVNSPRVCQAIELSAFCELFISDKNLGAGNITITLS